MIFPDDGVSLTVEPLGPIAQGDPATIIANIFPSPDPGTVFTWEVNGQVVDASTNSVTVAMNEQQNEVSVSFINSSGCFQIASITIPTDPPSYDIPNAFTPNGDEINDLFRIIIRGNIDLQEFAIFNRWGQKVFEGTANEGWDGRHNGEPAPADVYVFYAELRLPNGDIRKEKGDVTLLR
jgi:gliding motility-associated-like protein